MVEREREGQAHVVWMSVLATALACLGEVISHYYN